MVPYRDFQEFKPPMIFIVNALGLKLFGLEGMRYREFFHLLSLAGFVAIAVVILLVYRLRAWLAALFSGRPPPPARTDRRVIDVQYEIVDKNDDERR